MIKSWGFDFFPSPAGVIDDIESGTSGEGQKASPEETMRYFDFYLELWANAEAQGYDGVFLSEHHFGGGYSPSPNLLLPLIASRTRTMRLGIMGNVLPYHSPWRLVEEFRMLDNLTRGRLEIGTSAGIPAEFARIGMETAEARERFNEALEIIDAGLTGDAVSHTGKYWNFQDLPMVPPLVQEPHPPRWTTVISVDSAKKSARRGSKISTGFISTEDAKIVFDAYNEEAEKAGNPTGPEQLGLRRQVLMDLPEEVSSQYAQGFRHMLETFDKRTVAPGRKALDTPQKGTHGYSLGEEEFISGSPEEIAAQIIEQCQGCGAGHFLVTFAGHQTLEQLAAAWELFGKEVIPRLKSA